MAQIQKKIVLFRQDNAPCHKTLATMAKLHEMKFQLLPYPPYTQDLVPSDYYLFADLKNAPEKAIFVKCWSDSRNKRLLWIQRQILLQKRHRNVRETLEMYHSWRMNKFLFQINARAGSAGFGKLTYMLSAFACPTRSHLAFGTRWFCPEFQLDVRGWSSTKACDYCRWKPMSTLKLKQARQLIT